ncbi:MAG: dihydrolipoyl dehydrogenase [Xanthomonadales bacterium]|nr:dihydrolipoyl dehydrogenase [Gammaproteobacteria bacterium]NND55998.1 dihydrolipoyl dehydrogenase [Xanthomonadales bacterium]NNK52059.1 dihydrolipoyl dehydrogenase [Xanthomonadales bacterium]
MTEKFDVVVIGGGPGGYVSAIRAAQLGLKAACIDMYSDREGKASPGGTCLNVGCIPSKALLDSSKHYYHLQHEFAAHGISTDKAGIDVPTMIERKNSVVKKLTGGVSQLLKGNKVAFYHGKAMLQAGRKVDVMPADGGDPVKLEAENVILASGSVPIQIPNVAFDGEFIVDNVGALDFTEVPETLGVIGAGVIGLELGSVWNRLGAKVTLLEALPDFLALADKDIGKHAAREFKKQGLDVRLDTMVKSAEVSKGKVIVTVEDAKGESQYTFDRLLVSVGRKAYTEGLLGEDCGVSLTDRGQIEVDENSKTTAPDVWAIGDCVRGPMLAHKASEEGIAVAEMIAGKPAHIHFDTVPWVVYTDPEIAWVGRTEQELQAAGADYRTGSFPFGANGRALAGGHAAGMVKILADKETDEILGVHIISVNASELISECVVAMEFQGSSEDLARIIHAHPTLSEAIHEAALHLDGRAIHRGN